MGKKLTDQLSEQSTHAQEGMQVPTRSVSSTLLELKDRACKLLSTARLIRGALCGKTARRDLRGARPVMGGPTLICPK